MLEKLYIKNYLLLKDIEIDFSKSFNIITGETGAGKSILINAMSLILGERADYSIIGKNKEKMIIEGHIRAGKKESNVVNTLLKTKDISTIEEGYIILRRELYSKGYARNFINDSPVNVSDMKEIGDVLVDIHSQNEHQSLMKKEVHADLLDSYSILQSGTSFEKLKAVYGESYRKLLSLDKEAEELVKKKTTLDNTKSFLEFQLNEINDTSPVKGEDDEIEKELKITENFEAILNGIKAAYNLLYSGDGSAVEKIKSAETELDKIKQFDPDLAGIIKDLINTSSVINEVSLTLRNQTDKIIVEPDRIESMRGRLFKIQHLKKKYGGNLEAVLDLKTKLENDLSVLGNFDERISALNKEIKKVKENLFKTATEISVLRKAKAKKLEKAIEAVLKEIGLEHAEFLVDFKLIKSGSESNFSFKQGKEYISFLENGIDDIEFLIKVNKGNEFTSLRKTASGGEISRIMLAVKTVLAESDKVGILIFDEIDTGISGRIAQKAGKVLKNLSQYRQIISVTHLAQIAALADEHFLVEKETTGESTVTKIRKLDKKEKVLEVAKLLSGEKVTDSAIKSAKELIEG